MAIKGYEWVGVILLFLVVIMLVFAGIYREKIIVLSPGGGSPSSDPTNDCLELCYALFMKCVGDARNAYDRCISDGKKWLENEILRCYSNYGCSGKEKPSECCQKSPGCTDCLNKAIKGFGYGVSMCNEDYKKLIDECDKKYKSCIAFCPINQV